MVSAYFKIEELHIGERSITVFGVCRKSSAVHIEHFRRMCIILLLSIEVQSKNIRFMNSYF